MIKNKVRIKKQLLVAVLVGLGALVNNVAAAQTKIGYVAFNDLVQLMPEIKTIQAQMEVYQKEWIDQLQLSNTDYEKKLKDYQSQQSTLKQAEAALKLTELQTAKQRLDELNNKAQQAVTAKAEEFTKPLYQKIRSAVSAVAKEKGYNYVINSSQTDIVIAPVADNLMAFIKIRLGLK